LHLDTALETDAGKLPLLHAMEERAGERRSLAFKAGDAGLPAVALLKRPLTPTLSPLLRRGERELPDDNRLGMHPPPA
jgi:hypothetical protein